MLRLTPFGIVLAFLAAVLLLALSLIVGLLAVAAIFPRGHPAADRLRAFASQIPRLALVGLAAFHGLVGLALAAGFVVLALVYA